MAVRPRTHLDGNTQQVPQAWATHPRVPADQEFRAGGRRQGAALPAVPDTLPAAARAGLLPRAPLQHNMAERHNLQAAGQQQGHDHGTAPHPLRLGRTNEAERWRWKLCQPEELRRSALVRRGRGRAGQAASLRRLAAADGDARGKPNVIPTENNCLEATAS